MWRYLIPLTVGLAAVGWTRNTLATADTTPEWQPAIVETTQREPVVGVGYHPGNFIGPVAFDVIVRPLPHLTVDVQAGYWNLQGEIHGLGMAPQLQWEVLRGWQTPYVGVGFRYEEVWADGVKTASKGGFLSGGWQFRWQSGIGVLLGVGVLYRTSIVLNSPNAGYYSSGGFSGTYEGGVRYFF